MIGNQSYVLISLVVLLIIIFTPSNTVHGKIISGRLQKVDVTWQFLTRFCFLSDDGTFSFKFRYPAKYANIEILLYYDTIWSSVYGNDSMGCFDRRNRLTKELGQIITLSPSYTALCKVYQLDGEDWFNCTDFRTFRTVRERWWYIALANCDSKVGLDIVYDVHMTNGDDLLHKEFSADEFYILPVDIATLLLMLLMILISMYIALKLATKQLFHTTYKLYMSSLALYWFHLFLMCIAYGKYASSGYEQHATVVVARMFNAASEIVFLLLLILIGKGYTITRGKLSSGGIIKITIFICLYCISYGALFIWLEIQMDPAAVLYFYESVPGYCVLGLRILGWLWFLYAVFFSVKHYPEKTKFYTPLAGFYTIWFWATPVMVLVALKVMDNWAREKTVNGVENLIAVLGYIFMMIMTWPSLHNKFFPFHVRTSQIDVMINAPHHPTETLGYNEEDDDDDGRSGIFTVALEKGPTPKFSDIFVTSQTRNQSNGLNLIPSAAPTETSFHPL